MAGTQLLNLRHPVDPARLTDMLTHNLGTVTTNHMNPLRTETGNRFQNMVKQRPAGEIVHHLRQG